MLRRSMYAERFLLLKNTHKLDIDANKRTGILLRIIPRCIILAFKNTAAFLLCMTITAAILKLICEQRISCLLGNHHTSNNAHVITQNSLVRSAFFPTALISEEFTLAAQRVWRMQHEGTLSLSFSSTLQLVFLKTHRKAMIFSSLFCLGLFSSCDIIYLVFVSKQFTSIPCENMNQAWVIVLLA